MMGTNDRPGRTNRVLNELCTSARWFLSLLMLLSGCIGGFLLLARVLVDTCSADDSLEPRGLGDELPVDSHDGEHPGLRFHADGDGYYVVLRKRSLQETAWQAYDLVFPSPGTTTWSDTTPPAGEHVYYCVAEYTRAQPGDQDGEGMDDLWEHDRGLDPLDASDRDEDADGDLRSNHTEYQARTDPRNPDVDPPSIQPQYPAAGTTLHWIP